MKWLHRLMEYAIEIGVRDDNPMHRLKMEIPKGRDQVWSPDEVQAVIDAALQGGVASSGNKIPPRRSIALATRIAYATSLPQQDVLHMKWDQIEPDLSGVTVKQIKVRGKNRESVELWIPLDEPTQQMLSDTLRISPYVVVSEETRQPYVDPPGATGQTQRNVFSRLFRRIKKRAKIKRDLTFQDLRRTTLTELGNRGATNAEIVSFSGHDINSRVLKTYVKPDREAAMRAARKRDGERLENDDA